MGRPLARARVVAEQVADQRVLAALGRTQPREQGRGRRGGLLGGRELLRPDLLVDQPHEPEHAVPADRHRHARPHADVRRVGQPDRRIGPRQPLAVEPARHVGGRLAGEDRRQPHPVERLGVRGVREHAVAAVLDRHRAAEPRRQRVDEILQLGHSSPTLQMSNEVETVPVLGVRLTVRSFVA